MVLFGSAPTRKNHQLCRLGGQRVCPFLSGGRGWAGGGGGGGWNGRGNSPYTHLHFHAPPFSSVIFCSLSSKAEITLFLQAEQIVAKLMMNMAAVDKRLAEEQNRQAMVITLK